MALKQISDSRKVKINTCPECGQNLLTIDGKITQWLTCPNCKFKKLVRKQREGPRVTSLR